MLKLEEETHPRDGESSTSWLVQTLIQRRVNRAKDTVLSLMNHSTSDLSFQCRELLNVSVPVTLPSRNGQRAEKHNNSDSIKFPRLSEACTGLPTFSQWKELTLDAEPWTQDGSNSSNGKLHSSETKRKPIKPWMFQMVSMPKTEISTWMHSTEEEANNGISSTPRTGRVNQPPVNGIENMVLLSTKTSISFPYWEKADTLTILEEISWSSSKMVDQARNGTSINHQELSDPDQPTNHSISTTQEKETICNTTLPHQDGGKCSSTSMVTSPISKTKRLFQSRTERMKKLNQFGLSTDLVEDIHPKDGELPTLISSLVLMLIERRVNRAKDSASLSENHSISDPSFLCRESLNVLEPVTLPSRNGLMAEKHNNSDSTQSPRLSEVCTGLLTYSQWKVATLDAEPWTQDGSNSSDGLLHSLETSKKLTRSWMFQVLKTLKTEISSCTNSMAKFINNGILSTPRTGRVNQPPVNGTEIGASLSTRTSILFLD